MNFHSGKINLCLFCILKEAKLDFSDNRELDAFEVFSSRYQDITIDYLEILDLETEDLSQSEIKDRILIDENMPSQDWLRISATSGLTNMSRMTPVGLIAEHMVHRI